MAVVYKSSLIINNQQENQMRKLILTRVTLFALLLGAVGCNEGFEPEAGSSPLTENQTNVADSRDQVHYNKTCASQIEGYFENWYKLEHMRQAYSNIVGSTRAESDDIITATHYHYKFIPKDGAELTLLEDCPDLELFAYPLDAIVSEGEYFESENPLLRYAVVPVDKVLPDVEKELLYEMFIPDDSRTRMPTRCSHIDPEMADRLVAEAMRITGNEEEPVNKTRASKWYGRGCIKVCDDQLGDYIPVRGAKVRITRAGVTYTAITDSLGNFQMTDGFKYGASYSIIWERDKWDIRDGTTGQAYYQTDGNVTNQAWNLNIGSGKSIRYAVIHRACYRHFYHSKLGFLKAIPSDRKLKIGYMHEFSDGGYTGYFDDGRNGTLPDIRIYRGNISQYIETTCEILGTSFHELGHAGYWFNTTESKYENTDLMIHEAWAFLNEYLLLKEEAEYLTNCSNLFWGKLCDFVNNVYEIGIEGAQLQTWTNQVSYHENAPLFIDLVDDYNQHTSNSTYLYDSITGYDVVFLGSIIKNNQNNFTSLRDAIKNTLPNGITEQDIIDYFEQYRNYWVE